jgi:hypothetical protein
MVSACPDVQAPPLKVAVATVLSLFILTAATFGAVEHVPPSVKAVGSRGVTASLKVIFIVLGIIARVLVVGKRLLMVGPTVS